MLWWMNWYQLRCTSSFPCMLCLTSLVTIFLVLRCSWTAMFKTNDQYWELSVEFFFWDGLNLFLLTVVHLVHVVLCIFLLLLTYVEVNEESWGVSRGKESKKMHKEMKYIKKWNTWFKIYSDWWWGGCWGSLSSSLQTAFTHTALIFHFIIS